MPERTSSHRTTTVPAALAAVLDRDPARPLLTWYDDATGDRTELSAATLDNWVAKTANLLVDGCGLGSGDAAVVDAPPHWQVAAVLLGCWSAGLRVGAGAPDVVLASADRAGTYPQAGIDVFGLALAPLAAPMRDPEPGVLDFVVEVRGHGDHFQPPVPVGTDDPATELSHAELCRAAAQRAAAHGISPGARVLIDADTHGDPLDWLLAPLVGGASTVLCRNLAPDRLPDRTAAERVTLTLA